MATCCIDSCELDLYQENNECILHCEKTNNYSGFDKIDFTSLFYKELRNYINVVEKIPGMFTKIVFPERDNSGELDYINLLEKSTEIHFDCCEFTLSDIDLGDTHCFYQNCTFRVEWNICNSPVIYNENNVLYDRCVFSDNVSIYYRNDRKYKIKGQLFNNCKFKKNIEFRNVVFSSSIFNNTDDHNFNIREFKLSGCELSEKFVLNNCSIGIFLLEDTVFASKFEFKNNKVKNFRTYNSNFLKLVDMYETTYTSFSIEKSIFEDFVGFEKCVFGKSDTEDDSFVVRFTYTTFLSFVNFRSANFKSGLDIENINLKEPPNFLNVEINNIYSNRETYRIIKNSFDTVGNKIEANKFFSYEMKAYKRELKGTDQYQEKLILFFNENISDFGQSYIRPAILIIISAFIYYVLILGYENNILYRVCPDINVMLSKISTTLNDISKNILPFSRFLKCGMEFVSLIFYIIFAILIWQTVVAVKRHTQR